MDINKDFCHPFRTKMLILTIVIGLLISLVIPIIYFEMSIKEQKLEARFQSQEIALRIVEQLKSKTDSTSIKENVQKITKNILSNNQLEDISYVKIYNKHKNLIYREKLNNPSFFDVTGITVIEYNNEIIGYLEIDHKTTKTIQSGIILFILFTIIGSIIGYLMYKFPIRIIKQTQSEIDTTMENLKYMSYFDTLTDLPNRRQFESLLSKFLANAERKKHMVAVMFLDLDQFKEINDSYGHHVGDSLLQAFGQRLKTCIREGDLLARLGGDEFTIILPVIEQIDEVIHVADRIIKEQNKPYVVEEQTLSLQVSTSIGISIYPKNGHDAEKLVKSADQAMYKAKKEGKNRYQFL